MIKQCENDDWVHYQFETDASGEEYVTNTGKTRIKVETKYGYCKFNKKTEEFELVREKTDPHFFEKGKRTVTQAYVTLIGYKRKNLDFPDDIFKAYG